MNNLTKLKPTLLIVIFLLVTSFDLNQIDENVLEPAKSFGFLTGEHLVNEMGGFNYSIPIESPKGINGIEPSLSIMYDSRSGDSEVGYGWSLTGLAKISRAGRTFVQHGSKEGIQFSTDDIFLLNGQYLVNINGGYGTSGSLYKTENESFQNIEAKGGQHVNGSYSPKYFEISYPNGWKAELGNSEDSRLELDGVRKNCDGDDCSEILTWSVNRLYDRYGNYVDFKYEQFDKKLFVKTIEYTGNYKKNIAAPYSVRFNYDFDRSSQSMGAFIGGNEVSISKNLTEIQVYDNSTSIKPFKSYNLLYEISNNRVLLKEIKECNGKVPPNEICKKPIKFNYSQASRKIELNALENSFNPRNRTYSWDFVDLNGDGKQEFLKRGNGTANDTLEIHELDIDSMKYSISGNVSFEGDYFNKAGFTDKYFKIIDFDGNGLPDLLKYRNNGWPIIYYNDSDLEDFKFVQDTVMLIPDTLNIGNKYYDLYDDGTSKYFYSDLDGNGFVDVLDVYTNKVEIYLRYQQPNPRIESLVDEDGKKQYKKSIRKGARVPITYRAEFEITPTIAFASFQSGEFNGDGKVDLVYWNHDNKKPYFISFNDWQITIDQTDIVGGANFHNSYSKFIDINNDGLSDEYKVTSNLNYYLTNTGDGFIKQEFELANPTGWPLTNLQFGMTDFLGERIFVEHRKQYELGTFRITPSGVIKDKIELKGDKNIHVINGGWVASDTYWGIGFRDLDGDGIDDVFSNRATEFKVNLSVNSKKPNLLTSVVNGYNNEIQVNYSTTAKKCYKKSANKIEDGLSFSGVYPVVDKIILSNQIDRTNEVQYKYSGLAYDPKGRGLLGFYNIHKTDLAKGITVSKTFHQKFPLQGKITKEERWINENNDKYLIFSQINLWQTLLYKDGTILQSDSDFGSLYVAGAKSSEETLLNYQAIDKAINKDQTSDLKSILSRISIPFNEKLNNGKASLIGTIPEFNECQLTYLPLLKSSIIEKWDDNQIFLSRTSLYKNYDDFGFVKRSLQKFDDGSTIEELTSYDHNSSKNNWVLGMDTSIIKNYRREGKTIVREKTKVYDRKIGELSEEIREPGDKSSLYLKTEYKYTDRGNTSKKIKSTFQGDEQFEEYRYEDEYERYVEEIENSIGQVRKYEYDTRFNKIRKEYDLRGQYVEYSFDDFGNEVKVINPDNSSETTKYFYHDPTTKIGDPVAKTNGTISHYIEKLKTGSHPTTIYYNSYNEAVLVKYYGLEKNQIFESNEEDIPIIIEFEYDRFGRKIKEYLPSQAVIRDNQLFYSKGRFAEIEYDIFDRVIRQINPDKTIISLDYEGNSRSITNSHSQTTVEIFNSRGEKTLTVDNRENKLLYYYNPLGNLVRIETQKGFGVPSKNLVQKEIQYDKIGRKVFEKSIDGISTKYTYDGFDNLVGENKQADTEVRETSIVYDEINRIKSRTISGFGKHEYFYNRKTSELDSAIDHNNRKTKYYYDAKGRLERKSFELTEDSYYDFEYSYDPASKLKSKATPSGNVFSYSYKNDRLSKVVMNDTSLVWNLKQIDELGNTLEFVLGNGVMTNQKFNRLTGRLEEINSGSFNWQDWIKFSNVKIISEEEGISYSVPVNRIENYISSQLSSENSSVLEEGVETVDPFNIQKLKLEYNNIGNVKKRSDFVNDIFESFEYDDLNRIDRYDKLSAGTEYYRENFDYDELGNIVSRSSMGNYVYDSSNPYKLLSIQESDRRPKPKLVYQYNEWGEIEIEKKEKLKVSYNELGKVSSISKDKAQISIEYDIDLKPFQRTYVQEENDFQITSLGSDFEIQIDGGIVTYVDKAIIDGRLVASYQTNSSTKSKSSKYYHHDHLGSIVATTDSKGVVTSKVHYDPFGKSTMLFGNSSTNEVEGYTGHKLLSELDLIITANRIYDPRIGRFHSKDPIIQYPSNLKTYNPYSYVGNNPLSYVDPYGLGWDPIGDIVGGVTDIVGGILEVPARILGQGDEFEEFWDEYGTQIVVAAAAVAAGYFAGAYIAGLAKGASWGAVATGAAAGAAGGAAASATSVALNGGDFQDILKASFKGAVIGALAGAMFGAIGDYYYEPGRSDPDLFSGEYFGKSVAHGTAGGIQSELSGGKFGEGFVSASISNAVAPGIDYFDKSWSRIAAASVVGGTVNLISGRDVFMGATTAMFSRWFNHELDHSNNKYGLKLKPEPDGPTLRQGYRTRYMSESELQSYSPEYQLHHAYSKGPALIIYSILPVRSLVNRPYLWMLRNLKSDTPLNEGN